MVKEVSISTAVQNGKIDNKVYIMLCYITAENTQKLTTAKGKLILCSFQSLVKLCHCSGTAQKDKKVQLQIFLCCYTNYCAAVCCIFAR